MRWIDVHTHNAEPETGVTKIRNCFPEQADGGSFFSVGIHPWYINDSWRTPWELLEKRAVQKNCLAIGECGLDKVTGTDFQLQTEVFKAQIHLSERIQKPLIIHCVKAFQEIYNLHKELKPKQAWVMHGFSKSLPLAEQMASCGIKLSFGSALLANLNVQRTFAALALEQVFLETDNAAISVNTVYEKAALLKGLTDEELQKQLQHNFNTIFKP